MNRAWLATLFVIASILAISFVAILLGVRNRVDTQTQATRFEKLDGPRSVSFVPKNDFLNIVVLAFKNPGLENTEPFKFVLGRQGEEFTRVLNFSGRNMGDPSDLRFQFEPVADSKGKEFTISVTPVEISERNSVSIAVNSQGQPTFTAYYKTFDKTATFFGVLAGIATVLLGDKLFFVTWALILGILLWLGRKIN